MPVPFPNASISSGKVALWTNCNRTSFACSSSSNWSSATLLFSTVALRFSTNLLIQATTLMAFIRVPQRSTSNKGAVPQFTFSRILSDSELCSSKQSNRLESCSSSLPSLSESIQAGPPSHTWDSISSVADRPLVRRSAGFWSPAQCLHWRGLVTSCIFATLLATNCFQRDGSLLIQPRTIMESVQHWQLLSSSNPRAFLTISSRLAASNAPSNSNLGSDSFERCYFCLWCNQRWYSFIFRPGHQVHTGTICTRWCISKCM